MGSCCDDNAANIAQVEANLQSNIVKVQNNLQSNIVDVQNNTNLNINTVKVESDNKTNKINTDLSLYLTTDLSQFDFVTQRVESYLSGLEDSFNTYYNVNSGVVTPNEFSIVHNSGPWDSEISYYLKDVNTDTIVFEIEMGDFKENTGIPLTLPDSDYELTLLDDWGDGWNGASMEMNQGVGPILSDTFGFTSGSIAVFNFAVSGGSIKSNKSLTLWDEPELWKGAIDMEGQNPNFTSGSELVDVTIDDINWDNLSKMTISVANLVLIYGQPGYINRLIPEYSKTFHLYDDPKLCKFFTTSLFSRIYTITQKLLNVKHLLKPQWSAAISSTDTVISNMIENYNPRLGNYVADTQVINRYGNQTFYRYCPNYKYEITQKVMKNNIPVTKLKILNGIKPIEKEALTRLELGGGLLKCYNDFENCSIGYTDDENTFEFYDPVTGLTSTRIKYKLLDDTLIVRNSEFTALINNFKPGKNDVSSNIFQTRELDNTPKTIYSDVKEFLSTTDLTEEEQNEIMNNLNNDYRNIIRQSLINNGNIADQYRGDEYIDDGYVGEWRSFIKKPIADVLHDERVVLCKDGERISFDDFRIKFATHIVNIRQARRNSLKVKGEFPYLKKIDEEKNDYTSVQDVINNYGIQYFQTTSMFDPMPGAITIGKAFNEGGVQLCKMFKDLRDLYMKAAMTANLMKDKNGNLMTAEQLNTTIDGVLYDYKTVYLTNVTQTYATNDWNVLGYYYGILPTHPYFNVYNPEHPDFVGKTEEEALAYLATLTPEREKYYVEEVLPEPKYTNKETGVQQPYTRPLYDPETLPVTLTFDYCWIEHYQVDPVTFRPLKVDSEGNSVDYVVLSQTEFGNGVRFVNSSDQEQYVGGGFTSADGSNSLNLFKFSTYYCQVYQRVGLCMSNWLINENKGVEFGLYPQDIITWAKDNIYPLNAEKIVGSASGYSKYSFAQTPVNGVDPRTGKKATNIARLGQTIVSGNPFLEEKPINSIGTWAHEIFGHGMEKIIREKISYDETQPDPPIPLVNYTKPWSSSLNIVNGKISDEGYQIDDSIGQYRNIGAGASAEGFASYFELVGTPFIYRQVNQVGKTMDTDIDAPIAALVGLNSFTRLATRWVTDSATHDVTVARPYEWAVEFFSSNMTTVFLNAWERLLTTPTQQLTYAVGMINTIDTVKQIEAKMATHEPPLVFDSAKFNYWMASEMYRIVGPELTELALSVYEKFAV